MEIDVLEWLKDNDQQLKANDQLSPRHRHFDNVRQRAKSSCKEFNLTVDDFEVPEKCPILGIPLSLDLPRSHWPSMDRVDNSKGYIKGNVRIISNKANTLKNDNTLETLEKIIQYLKG